MGRAIVNRTNNVSSANSRIVSGSIGTLTSPTGLGGRAIVNVFDPSSTNRNLPTETNALEGRAIVNVSDQPSVNRNSLVDNTTNEGEIIPIRKKLYSRNQYEKVIDTKFSQLANSTPSTTPTPDIFPEELVSKFFQDYENLFYIIPKTGATNSHEYLIKTSSEYINYTPINDDIQALIDEINLLQRQNLELNQQIVELQVSSSQQTNG